MSSNRANAVSDFFSTFDDAKRMVAKLMAQENIAVQVIDGASTAWFDTVARVLTIPNWPGLTCDQHDLLLAHEVGHALFTNNDYIKKCADNPTMRGLMTYINVVEDARIERKMKAVYPGLKRIFYHGYETFYRSGPIFKGKSNGIYGPDGVLMPIGKMRLIDRINCFFKIGGLPGIKVPFTAAEAVWLDRIERCADFDEALAIAEALYKFAKEQREQEQQQQKAAGSEKQKAPKSPKAPKGQQGESGDDDDADDSAEGDKQKSTKKSKSKKAGDDESDGDDDGSDGDSSEAGDEDGDEDGSADTDGDSDDDADADGDASGSKSSKGPASDTDGDDDSDDDGPHTVGPNSAQRQTPDGGNEDDVALTDQMIKSALNELANQQDSRYNVRNVLLKPVSDREMKERTVTAADYSDMCHTALGTDPAIKTVLDKLQSKWNTQYLATAQHMALEFERRKSAKAMMHAKTAKSGKLNMGKLHAYKFSEDLFQKVMTIPNGQSHGIVMVIDASGSMSSVYPQVLDQVLLFAHFAFQCNIPFEAYMFTDTYAPNMSRPTMASTGMLTIAMPDGSRLVGLINTTANRGAFRKQVQTVLAVKANFVMDASLDKAFPNVRPAIRRMPFVGLGGTPLLAGLMMMERHVERMKRVLRLDKVMTVLITDGEDTDGLWYETQEAQRSGKLVKRFAQHGETGLVVRDTVTKKNHILVNTNGVYGSMNMPENGMMTLMMDVMKSRHDTRNIVLFLATCGYRTGQSIHNSLGYLTRFDAAPLEKAKVTQTVIDASIQVNKQYVLPANIGVADLVIGVPTEELQLTENNFAKLNTKGMTQNQIASQFTDAMKKAISNRVFVNTVVPFLA